MSSGLFPFLFFIMSKTVCAVPYSKREEGGTRKKMSKALSRVKHQRSKELYVQKDQANDE